MYHNTPPYLLNPSHTLTIDLVGVGGTGSQVLTALARINYALTKLGHPGLYVRAFDPDVVTAANCGRQAFYEQDIGVSKAIAAVARINRAFGLAWQGLNVHYGSTGVKLEWQHSNYTITCVDTISARKDVVRTLFPKGRLRGVIADYGTPYYWIDAGNTADTGQVVIGSVGKTESLDPDHVPALRHVMDLYPGFAQQQDDDTPSCSLMEALEKQDLFINSFIANTVSTLLWKQLREARLHFQGVFINLRTFQMNPLPIS